MTSSHPSPRHEDLLDDRASEETPDAEALFVALVLAPGTFPRNRFFDLFKVQDLKSARRRAQIVRSLIKELTEPWPHPGKRFSRAAPVKEKREQKGDLLHLSYQIEGLCYRREAILTSLEAATLNYALCRSGVGEISEGERKLVEQALSKLSPG